MSAAPVFHASGRAGLSAELLNDPRCRRARKRALTVLVHFAPADCLVQTLEGPVRAHAQDAIVTGAVGEQWPVARARFAQRYQPVAPLAPGLDGSYMTVPAEVLALQMDAPFSVVLADGDSHLAGAAGDWLLDYGDGSLGIVGADIFTTTYDLID
jgi:hypothetical protein